MRSINTLSSRLESLPLDVLEIIQTKNDPNSQINLCLALEKNPRAHQQGYWQRCLETLSPASFYRYIKRQRNSDAFDMAVALYYGPTGQWLSHSAKTQSQLLRRAQVCFKLLITGLGKNNFRQQLTETLGQSFQELTDEHALNALVNFNEPLLLSSISKSAPRKMIKDIFEQRLSKMTNRLNNLSKELQDQQAQFSRQAQWDLLTIVNSMIKFEKNASPVLKPKTTNSKATEDYSLLVSKLIQSKYDYAYQLLETIAPPNKWRTLVSKRANFCSLADSEERKVRFRTALGNALTEIPAADLIKFMESLICTAEDDPLTFLFFTGNHLAEAIEHADFEDLYRYFSQLFPALKNLLKNSPSKERRTEIKTLCLKIKTSYAENLHRWNLLEKLRLLDIFLSLSIKKLCESTKLSLENVTDWFRLQLSATGEPITAAEKDLHLKISTYLTPKTNISAIDQTPSNAAFAHVNSPLLQPFVNPYQVLAPPAPKPTRRFKKFIYIKFCHQKLSKLGFRLSIRKLKPA